MRKPLLAGWHREGRMRRRMKEMKKMKMEMKEMETTEK